MVEKCASLNVTERLSMLHVCGSHAATPNEHRSTTRPAVLHSLDHMFSQLVQ